MAEEIVKKEEFSPFVIMDKLDDELIIAELEGKVLDTLVYHYKDKGQELWGLSKAGVDEATGELAKRGEVIREVDVDVTWDDSFFYAKAKAGRYVVSREGQEVLLDTKFGSKRQDKKWKRGTDEEKENPFAYELAITKACRNASIRLIPKAIQQAVIEAAKKKGGVKQVSQEENKPPISNPIGKNSDAENHLKQKCLAENIGWETFMEFCHVELKITSSPDSIEDMPIEKSREIFKNFETYKNKLRVWHTQTYGDK